MRVIDSRENGGGIWPLQDHRDLSDRENAEQLLAVRVVGRDASTVGLGALEHDDAVGDVLGGFYWEPLAREYGSWGFIRSCMTFEGGRTGAGVQRGPIGNGHAPNVSPRNISNGGAGVDRAPTFNGRRQSLGQPSINIFDQIGQQSGAINNAFRDRGLSVTRESAASTAVPPGVVRAARINDDADPLPIVPSKGEFFEPDEKFVSKILPQPDLWPAMPAYWGGIAVADTTHDRQVVHWHPTDPRIPLPHRGDSYSVGALACDMIDSTRTPDPKRHARLHSMLRIVKSPPRSPAKRNSVGWNLSDSGLGDALGGIVIDRAKGSTTTQGGGSGGRPAPPISGSRDRRIGGTANTREIERAEARQIPGAVRPGLRAPGDAVFNPEKNGRNAAGSVVIAYASHNFEGPLHPGRPGGDPHEIGRDGDKNPVNPLHLSIRSYFIDPKSTEKDGELNVTRFVRGGNLDYETRVYFGWDRVRKKWDWWTTAPEESYPPGDNPPEDDPPDEPPPPPPSDPGPPPGPTTPPQQPGDPDPVPPPPSGPGAPPGPTTPPDDPFPPPPLPPGHGYDEVFQLSTQGSSSPATTAAVPHTRRWLEQSTAAMSFRAQEWGDGKANLVRSPSHPEKNLADSIAPTVARFEVFAEQDGGFTYTAEPGTSRYQGGTADGGLWLLPPEVTGEDYGSDFAPGDRAISTSYLGAGPGARLAVGLPDRGTGAVRDGHSLYADSGDLVVDYHNSSGTTIVNARLTTDGALELRELGGDPSNPPAGYLAIYAKSTGLFIKDSGGTVTGPLTA